MYNVSDAVIEAYQTDGVHKELRIVIDNTSYGNEYVVDGSFNLKQAILESEAFEAIGCNAASMSVELHAQFPTKIRGSRIKAFISAGGTTEIQIFDGYVDKCTKTANGWKRSIEAYDILYELSGQSGHSTGNAQNKYDVTDWFNEHADCTLSQLLTDICSKYSVSVREGNMPLVNGSVTTTCGKVKSASGISALDVIKSIMQLNGCFGYITGDGYFSWMYLILNPRDETGMLYPSQFNFPSNTLYPGQEDYTSDPATSVTNFIGEYEHLEYQDYNMLPIDKVIIRNGEKDENAGSAGSGENVYIIEGNILVKDKEQSDRNTMAQQMLNILNSTYYVPFSADLMGLPYLQCGDEINFMDFTGDAGRASLKRYYIMSRTLSGGQHLKDSFSANGDEYLHEFKTGQSDSSGGEDVEQAIDDLRDEIADEYPTTEEVEDMLDSASGLYRIVSISLNDLPQSPDANTLYLIQGECRILPDDDGSGEDPDDPSTHPDSGDDSGDSGDSGDTTTTTLASLSDVQITNPAAGQSLKYNGSKWINSV